MHEFDFIVEFKDRIYIFETKTGSLGVERWIDHARRFNDWPGLNRFLMCCADSGLNAKLFQPYRLFHLGALQSEFGEYLRAEFGGWAPARWLAEKPLGAIPEAYRAAMREYPDQGSNAQNYRERTKANVRDCHATLILVEKLPLEGGTKLTRDFAASIGRSHHVVDMSAVNAKEDALAWAGR